VTLRVDALRLELHPFGIHVAMIEPGSIRTPAVDKTLGDVDRACGRGAQRPTRMVNLPPPAFADAPDDAPMR